MEKPPFHYAQIIAMAMMENGRMTLKDICKWIQERFAYFRYNKNWNVCINLKHLLRIDSNQLPMFSRILSDTIYHCTSVLRKLHAIKPKRVKADIGNSL